MKVTVTKDGTIKAAEGAKPRLRYGLVLQRPYGWRVQLHDSVRRSGEAEPVFTLRKNVVRWVRERLKDVEAGG